MPLSIVVEGIQLRGGKALAKECDVSNRNDVETMAKKIIEVFGQVDILVNNAEANTGLIGLRQISGKEDKESW